MAVPVVVVAISVPPVTITGDVTFTPHPNFMLLAEVGQRFGSSTSRDPTLASQGRP
ncbi:MAG: hypothetical protein OEM84_02315 [Acidimicrobiia bacterium]|nr:hypothetical protein [Acidimicrobiia bacterium]